MFSLVRQSHNIRMMCTFIRQRFSEKVESAINKQINMELEASYKYLSMAYHFDRTDVALKGLHQYFKSASDDEREHAMKFMTYLNKRGGKITLENIEKPEQNEWGSPVEAMKIALDLEKKVNDSLLDMHALAENEKDAHFTDFLEEDMLQEQVDAIKEIGDHITNLRRCGEGLGEFIFDEQLKGDGNK